MKREKVRLYRERRWTVDDRMLVDTSLPVEPIPLMKAGPGNRPDHDGTKVIGTVTDVRRGRRGWVLGTLNSQTPYNFVGLHCEADFDKVVLDYKTRRGTARGVLRNARLRAVTVGERPCWKGMRIK